MKREDLTDQIIEAQRRMNRVLREHTLDSWVNLSLTIEPVSKRHSMGVPI